MKLSFSVLLVLCLATIVISHRKDKDEVKKIVKVIEFDDDVVEGRRITNGWFSQQDAQNACTGMGAVLTGFQNENERMTVARKALNMTTTLGRTVAGLWFIISPNFVAGPEDWAGWKPAFVNGDLDKYQCNSQVYPRTRFYICGKRGVRK
ncbi:unnamed protein product [Caenorhabditis nigoni]